MSYDKRSSIGNTGGCTASDRSSVFDARKLTETSATSPDSRSSLRDATAPSAANNTIASTVRSITFFGSLLGSYGPTTAGRMDSYVDQFQAHGGSFVMLAKGNRSKAVTDACAKHGGFYLGSIGGPAARLAQDCIKKVEVLDFEDLGMEAVWKIDVVDFPAFIVVDDKGNDFFQETMRPLTIGLKPEN